MHDHICSPALGSLSLLMPPLVCPAQGERRPEVVVWRRQPPPPATRFVAPGTAGTKRYQHQGLRGSKMCREGGQGEQCSRNTASRPTDMPHMPLTPELPGPSSPTLPVRRSATSPTGPTLAGEVVWRREKVRQQRRRWRSSDTVGAALGENCQSCCDVPRRPAACPLQPVFPSPQRAPGKLWGSAGSY